MIKPVKIFDLKSRTPPHGHSFVRREQSLSESVSWFANHFVLTDLTFLDTAMEVFVFLW